MKINFLKSIKLAILDRRRLNMKRLVFVLFINFIVNMCFGEAAPDLYFLKMNSLVIPKEVVQKCIDEKPNSSLSDFFIYSEIFKNDKYILRLPLQNLGDSKEKDGMLICDYSAMHSFPLLWKSQDAVCCKVFAVHKDAVEASKGGVEGAKAGAYRSFRRWFIFSDPAPSNSFIGDICDLIIGATRGYLYGTPFDEDDVKEIASFVYESSDKFDLYKTKNSVALSKDKSENPTYAQVSFSGRLATVNDCVKAGGLKLQETYLVRFPSLFISSRNPDAKKGAKYYVVLDPNGDGKDLLEFELGTIALDEIIHLDVLALLKNQGGKSRIRVYRRINYLKDKCVFEGVQYATDGKSWIFQTTSKDDFESSCVMETYRILQ